MHRLTSNHCFCARNILLLYVCKWYHNTNITSITFIINVWLSEPGCLNGSSESISQWDLQITCNKQKSGRKGAVKQRHYTVCFNRFSIVLVCMWPFGCDWRVQPCSIVVTWMCIKGLYWCALLYVCVAFCVCVLALCCVLARHRGDQVCCCLAGGMSICCCPSKSLFFHFS